MDKKKYGWKIWNEETEKEGERGREKEREISDTATGK